jgi:polypeptide N-acetylgalactosaminyltransferase
LSNLPTVSAIIPVYNEHFSIVMRTAHSIMNRAQGDLVREVIFVNDQSEAKFLNSTFDEYVAQNFKGRGRVIHLKERVGLIQARMAGARIATSDVLLFADGHTEATINYLPPMLDPIAENYRVVTIPIEDALDVHNFEYPPSEENNRAIFDWSLNYWTVPVRPEDAKDPSKPYRAPLMKGGIFAISAKFFWELDGYDDQLEIWGGEQYEISFKVWMCGGAMYQIPCSHFGHMFRSDGRPFHNPKPYNYITRNYKRVIEVWMDEYKEYIYMRDPASWSIDAGPLLRQHAIREKLKCKSFDWYLKTVAPEILEKYPVLGWPWFAKGWVNVINFDWFSIYSRSNFQIRSMASERRCVTVTDDGVALYPCQGNRTHPSWGQRFELSYFRDIAQYNIQQFDCVEPYSNKSHSELVKTECTLEQGNQLWKYDPVSIRNDKKNYVKSNKTKNFQESHMLLHDLRREYCLEGNPRQAKVFLNHCDDSNKFQKWEWSRVNRTMLKNWDTMGKRLM